MTLHFLREMDRLNAHLIEIGNRIEDQVSMAFHAVVQQDEAAARRVIRGDVEIDNIEIQMEEECLKLLALYQPVANDLRLIVSILKINTDLERIGDHAKNIAQSLERLPSDRFIEIPETLHAIFRQSRLMLRKSLLAFVESDRKLAEAVLAMDDKVDTLCREELPRRIEMIERNPGETRQHLVLLSVCRQLERIGDHASNIAEDVVYLLSGDIIRHGENESLREI